MLKIMLAALALALLPASLFAQDSIRITNGEWPPYLSEKLKHSGVISHVVTEAFAAESIKVNYGFFPWKRAFKNAQNGNWDASVVWSKNAEREKTFLYSDPIFSTETVFFFLKKKAVEFTTLEALGEKDLRLGATIGYSYTPEFEVLEKAGSLRVTRVVKDEQSLRKLLKGRLDLFIVEKNVGLTLINQLFTEAEAATFGYTKAVADRPYFLIISKKCPNAKQLLQKFNAGLKKLNAAGKVEKMMGDSNKGVYKK